MDENSIPITQLLADVGQGNETAQKELWDVIYSELQSIAQRQLAVEGDGHTMQPTALVHEAFFRLFGGKLTVWSNRQHFFGSAARAMCQIRVDYARKKKRLKRGGDQQPGAFMEEPVVFEQDNAEVIAIDEALKGLEQENPRKAVVVRLRYFVGLSEKETAAVLGIARRTVQNDWLLAKAWLHREFSKGDTTTHLSR